MLFSAVLLSGAFFLARAATDVAARADRSGEQVVKVQCSKCHEAGLLGAPKIADRTAWSKRMKNGLDATVRSAIHGHGAMPARGGMADLSDAELRAAILYLFNPAGTATQAAAPAVPADPYVKRAGGIEVHLGVISANAIRARNSKPGPETTMHGGIPRGDGQYHVNVSLRDAATQAIIGDARVEASVTSPVMGGETKKLELMKLEGDASYGNYFRMTGREPHVITVRIGRPGSTHETEAKFEYKE